MSNELSSRCAAWLAAAALVPTTPAQRPEREFTLEIEHPRLPALDQGRTGTCWAFSTTSFLESELERIHGRRIDLSEAHTVYFAYVEKARRFVRLHGKTQFSEGGLSHDVLWLIQRHGAVPQARYTGLSDGDERHDHRELHDVLRAIVEQVAGRSSTTGSWDAAIRGVLDAYLGAPPTSIEVGDRNLTPVEYARSLAIPFPAYRQLMSLESEPYWRETELLVPDNWLRHQRYWNVPLDALMANLDHALRSGFTAAIDIDVSEPATRRRAEVWELPDELEGDGAVTAAVRQAMFDTRETTDDHLMHVVGLARDPDGKRFYLTKNSHGSRGQRYPGHVLISRNYLMAKMLSFMVHEDALLPDARK